MRAESAYDQLIDVEGRASRQGHRVRCAEGGYYRDVGIDTGGLPGGGVSPGGTDVQSRALSQLPPALLFQMNVAMAVPPRLETVACQRELARLDLHVDW